MVLCPYCKKRFDRDKEPFIKVSERRYAHEECAKQIGVDGIVTRPQIEVSTDNQDKVNLMNYIDLLWNKQANYMIINRQLKTYLGNKYRYTYKGIHNALIYYYDITKHPVQMEYNSIGIVPYCYDKAQTYFKKIADARERNKNVGEIKDDVREIHIPIPQTTVRKRKLFTFFEEDN